MDTLAPGPHGYTKQQAAELRIVRLTGGSANGAQKRIERMRHADVVIDGSGVVVKDRYGQAPRRSNAVERQAAVPA